MEAPSNQELARRGTFEVYERVVPGLERSPEVAGVDLPTDSRERKSSGRLSRTRRVHGDGPRSDRLAEILDWAQALGVVVLSVDYRLAPETPRPGPATEAARVMEKQLVGLI
ncbi:alpha/beta hydrolase fold domain-containing protein [Nesterenkonia halotolerans]|uniref:alpha/beta hydrolase fold domain-containing protein n=1 Tax=Nesterenkonia halotolerans TaxID=225325 RepID=UPI001CEF479B